MAIEDSGDRAFSSQQTFSVGFSRYVKWYPLLVGPLAMVWVYVAKTLELETLVSRNTNERIALVLMGISLAGFILQTVIFRSEFHLFMAALCTAFFCREWHFVGTSNGVYIALAVLAFWAVKRKDKLEKIIGKAWLNVWLWSTFATYLLSQLIARRVFRYIHLPQEEQLHVLLEETVETAAHLMMILTCFIATRAKSKRD